MSGIAITFPSSAVEGQSYLAQNGFTYIYDSQKNRWKRGGEFVRAPKVLSYAGVAATTTGAGITTSPTGSLIYVIPGTVNPNSEVGVDSYKAYRAAESYPNYTEVQVSISSAFSSIAYAATFTGTTHTIPPTTLSGDTTYYLRARQFVGSNASAASTGAISGYSANPVKFTSASVYLDTPTIVSIAGTTSFPVYQVGFAGTTLPATVTYGGGGLGNLDKVEWRITGPRIPSSTGDTALAEVGIGTHSSATLANALVLAMPFSGATGVGITNDVNNAIRTASGASAGTTKTVTANGGIGTSSIAGLALTSHFYPSAASGDGADDYLTVAATADLQFGSGDFTIEFWWYPNGTGRQALYHGSFGIDWSVGIDYSSVSTNQKIGIWASSNGSSWNMVNADAAGNGICNSVVPQKQWNHIAYVRRGNTFNLYLNGLLDCSASASGSIVDRSAYPAAIGTWYNNTALPEFTGYLQDLKVYKGLAKYQENFTPPLPTYGTISYTTGTPNVNVGVATTAFFESTGDTPTAEVAIGSSTAAQVASSLVLAMPMNRTFGFQDINVAVRGLTSGASAGTAKTVGLGTTSTANAPTHPIISSTESKWYDGAAYFDKSKSQYATSTSSDYAIGANDVTIECWINTTDVSSAGSGSHIFQVDGAATNILLAIAGVASGDIRFLIRNDSGTNLLDINTPANTINTNTWYHLAATLSGTTGRIFINGNLIASGTLSGTRTHTGTNAYFGTNVGSRYYGGYLQDLKFYKGFAKYTANFTPPQPICGFTTDISTQTGFTTTTATGALLSSVVGLGSTSTLAFSADQNLAGVTSITSSSGITTLPDPYAQNLVLALPLANITGVGNSFTNDRNTQIRSVSITGAGVTAGTTKTITNTGVTTSTSVTKYYGNTASFNGSSNYLSTPNDTDFNFGSGDFTIEAFVNINALGTGKIITNYIAATATTGNDLGWIFGINTSNQLEGVLYSGSSAVGLIQAGSLTTGRWYHVSYVRKSSSFYMFLDGQLIGTATGSASHNTNSGWNVSFGYGHSAGTQYMNGYLQDLRIYKGVAKYTTNFTPPPPMFGDYTRSTPNKLIFTPSSDYVLEARNTSGVTTSSYSATRQWGTKPKGGIYDPYASNLVLAIPGGAVGGATTTFDVTGQIRYETPTASYVNAGIVTYSNSLGIGTYQNKTVTDTGGVITSTTQSKYYGRSLFWNGGQKLQASATISSTDFTAECWVYFSNSASVNETCIEFTSSTRIIMGRNSTGVLRHWVSLGSIGDTLGTDTIKMASATWYHIAFTKKDTTIYGFINGVQVLQRTNENLANVSSGTISIGRNSDNAEPMTGYMNDIRVYNGVAKYTSNFTPPNQIYLT